MATSEQLGNAQTILNVGVQVGANAKQLLASIEAALVESRLKNVPFGDRDSLGLFQQRPSQGWGTPNQVLNPPYAARAFFVGAGSNKGALQVSQSGTAGQLAQRVQRSAYPGRYDEKEGEARKILAQLGYSSSLPDVFNGVLGGAGGGIGPDGDWHLAEYMPEAGSVDTGMGTVLLVVGGVVLLVLIAS